MPCEPESRFKRSELAEGCGAGAVPKYRKMEFPLSGVKDKSEPVADAQ